MSQPEIVTKDIKSNLLCMVRQISVQDIQKCESYETNQSPKNALEKHGVDLYKSPMKGQEKHEAESHYKSQTKALEKHDAESYSYLIKALDKHEGDSYKSPMKASEKNEAWQNESPMKALDKNKVDSNVSPINGIPKHEVEVGGTTFRIYKHYELIRIVGSGAFGVVGSGKNTLTNTNVAIKKIPNLFNDLIDAKRVLREIKLLSIIYLQYPIEFFNHKNIISLIDIILPDDPHKYNEIYLIFELMQTDLQHVIQSNLVLSDKQINWFMYQMLVGVHHLHSAVVIHRDLKPNNLLVNKNCDLKIGDLNLARKFDQTNFITDYVVTRWYRAPEVILSQSEYTKAIDMWSVGCILGELLGRTILFQGQNPVEQIEKIIAVLGTPKEDDLPYTIEPRTLTYLNQLPKRESVQWKEVYPFANPLAVDLLSKLLVYNPDNRFNVNQCLEHPYFPEVFKKFPPTACEDNFDWSFDTVEPNKITLMQAIYEEAQTFQ